jgi:hypothetical protein
MTRKRNLKWSMDVDLGAIGSPCQGIAAKALSIENGII